MISVVIPVLNEEKLLPGLLRQFTPELCSEFTIEIIVSDGGSTDATVAAAEEYGARVVRHLNATKQTIAEGRNAGAAIARGGVLLFLNGDVLLGSPENFFQEVNRFVRSGAVAATCSIRIFPNEETLVDKLFHGVYNRYIRLLNLAGEGMGRGECQLIRKEVFDALGGYSGDLVAGEDYDLFRRAKRKGRIMMLKGVVVYESPRRFRKYGYTHILWSWIRNAYSVMRYHRSASDTWEPVR